MYKKGVVCVQSCSFANLNLLFFFCRSRYCRHCCCSISALLLSSRNLAILVTWRHTSPLYSLSCLKCCPGVIMKLFWGMLHNTIRDLTIWQWWRQWKLCWKIDFASFKNFPPLYQVTRLLKRRKVRFELKTGDRIRVQREEVKFIALPFPFSSQLKIWSFHIVVVKGQQRMYKKTWCTCRVVVLLIKFSVFWLSRCCHHRSFIRSLLSSSQYTVPFSKYSWPMHATFLYMPGESRRKNQDIPGWIQSWEKKRIKKGNIIKFCSGFWTARFTEHVELK